MYRREKEGHESSLRGIVLSCVCACGDVSFVCMWALLSLPNSHRVCSVSVSSSPRHLVSCLVSVPAIRNIDVCYLTRGALVKPKRNSSVLSYSAVRVFPDARSVRSPQGQARRERDVCSPPRGLSVIS